MTTQEIVKKIVEYINAGKNVQAEEELYADDVLSVEQNGYSAQGKAAIIEKTKGAMANFEEFFGGGVTKAFVGKDHFLLEITMDVKPKGGERMKMTEYGFYKVKDGKISEEYFFAEPLA
jgi:ketosteroid isomerase-like protein